MPQRLLIMILAGVVGGIFAAGLFIHGRVGGGLLLVAGAILIVLSRATWNRVRPQGRPLRMVVVAAILALGIVKLVHG
jgi:hypothetical protein